MTITTISVTLCSAHLAAEETDEDAAVAAVLAALEAAYPGAEVEVEIAPSLVHHKVEVATADGWLGPGDREVTDVRDVMLEAFNSLIP